MDEPRKYTADEIADQIIEHVWEVARYWAADVSKDASPLDRTSGMAHSVLAMLDGCSMDLPAFKLVCEVAPEDPEYLRGEGKNWYEPGEEIAVMLHERLYRDDLRRDQESTERKW